VAGRVDSGDVDGDGDDVVMAYQNADGTFGFHVWRSGTTYAGIWYTSGPFDLNAVAETGSPWVTTRATARLMRRWPAISATAR
jgi:hypothetical protein